MAFKRLYFEEMLQLSGTWIDPTSEAHLAILATPDLAPTIPHVTAAHNLLASLAQPAQEDPRLAEIIKEESALDPRHDDLLRGTHGLLTGAALLLGEGGGELLALRDTLIPDGLESTQKSYRAEAGQAAQLAARLTPALRTQLASIVVDPKDTKKTLESFVNELLKIGARLGALEDDKGRLQPAPSEHGNGRGAALLAARNQWVRVANALVANNALAGLDAETDKLIFGPLRAADKAAERRGKGAPAKEAGATAPAASGAAAAGEATAAK